MRPPNPIIKLIFITCLASLLAAGARAGDRIDLAGSWRLALDRENAGIGQQWHAGPLPGDDALELPGSLQAQGFGEKPSIDGPWTAEIGMGVWRSDPKYARYLEPENFRSPVFLMPARLYVGAAWYQREITVPPEWTGRHLRLHLERPHWKTTVWVDGRETGPLRLLGTPHVHDLGPLEPGNHRLTIRVDNSLDPNVGPDAHSVSDQTQSNWNGIAGRIELVALPTVSIARVRTFPDVVGKSVRIELRMSTATGTGTVRIEARGANGNPHQAPTKSHDVTWKGGIAEVVHPLGPDARLWDEHEPNLYHLTATLTADCGASDVKEVLFGLREWGIADRMFTVNGKITKLRGTLDCAIWPLTGYPATDVESWRKVMRACRDFGLNHVRFHSWCPPEAAFIAADELGLYLQVEAGIWSHHVGEDKALQEWVLKEEAPAILEAYGNHASFFGFGIGNEGINRPSRTEFSGRFVEQCRARDGRHLYTDFAHTGASDAVDYEVRALLSAVVNGQPANFNVRNLIARNTRANFTVAMAHVDRPVIAHETVQQAIMPDFQEMERYTGVLKPLNYEIFRDVIHDHNMGGFEEEMFMSQGRFQTLLYKAEIEAAMRSRHYAGYQLLGINDFSGQGTALVGALNVFWEPKRYVTAAEYRRFQNTVVPLAEFDKRVWTKGETLSADLVVAHFGPADFNNQSLRWTLAEAGGAVVGSGVFEGLHIPQGGVHGIGRITVPLDRVAAPAELTLDVAIEGTDFANSWNFHVYDRPSVAPAPEGVLVATALTRKVVETLRAGGKVCLFVNPERIGGAEGVFSWLPFAWNQVTFPQQKNVSKGLLIQNRHPALAAFPTRSFSTWQWQEALESVCPMDLSHVFPADERAIVQVNDSWTHGRKLGLVFEANIEGGRLLFCSLDLNKRAATSPVLAQLRRSLLNYAASDAFNPQVELAVDQLADMMTDPRKGLLAQIGGRIVSVSSENDGFGRDQMMDGVPETFWHSRFQPEKAPLPQSVVLELPKVLPLQGLRYLPRQDSAPGRVTDYAVYLSDDGKTWNQPVKVDRLPPDDALREIRFDRPTEARFVKFEVREALNDVAAIAELDIIFDVDEAIRQGLIDPAGFRLE